MKKLKEVLSRNTLNSLVSQIELLVKITRKESLSDDEDEKKKDEDQKDTDEPKIEEDEASPRTEERKDQGVTQ